MSVLSPRNGLACLNDRLVGPGATKTEIGLMWLVTVLAPIVLYTFITFSDIQWSTLQLTIALLIAADLAGGAVANALNSGKLWWHRPGQGPKQIMGFNCLHLHPLLIAWLFLDMNWSFFFINYGYLLVATFFTVNLSVYLQRPMAYMLYLFIVLVNHYLVEQAPGLEWFAIIFFLKLLIAHNLPEKNLRDE